MNTNRQWLLAKRPHGLVGEENFEYVETPIPEAGDGEVLVRNLYFSFDPTQRGWMEDRESYLPPVQLGEPMRAGSIGQVVESNHPDFTAKDIVESRRIERSVAPKLVAKVLHRIRGRDSCRSRDLRTKFGHGGRLL